MKYEIQETLELCECGKNFMVDTSRQLLSDPLQYTLYCDCGKRKYMQCDKVRLKPGHSDRLAQAIGDYTDMLNSMGADKAEFIELVETVNLLAKVQSQEKFNKIFENLCDYRDELYGKGDKE